MGSEFFSGLKSGDRIEIRGDGGELEFSNPKGERHHLQLPEVEGSGGVASYLADIVSLLNSALALSGHGLYLVEVWDDDERLFGGDVTLQRVQDVWREVERKGEESLYCNRYVFELR
ncbi:MAG: hypothetical protein AAB561_02320 [Patescibacteria group bacterium]